MNQIEVQLLKGDHVVASGNSIAKKIKQMGLKATRRFDNINGNWIFTFDNEYDALLFRLKYEQYN